MADFVQTMKDWRRMCKHYTDESLKANQLSCVDICPLGHNTVCGIIEDALDGDIEAMAKLISEWATKNPEPVYPTWVEWFLQIGVVKPTQIYFHDWLLEPIPDDIAQKLGIEPKEG